MTSTSQNNLYYQMKSIKWTLKMKKSYLNQLELHLETEFNY